MVNDYEEDDLAEEGVEEPRQGLSEESRGVIRGGVGRVFDKYDKSKKAGQEGGEEGGSATQSAEGGQESAKQEPGSNKKEGAPGDGKSPATQADGNTPTPPLAKKVEEAGEKQADAGVAGSGASANKAGGGSEAVKGIREGARQVGDVLDRVGQAQRAARIGSDIARNPQEAAKEAARAAKDEAIRRAKEEAKKRAIEAAKKKIAKELAKRGLIEAAKMVGKQGIGAIVGVVGWPVVLIVLAVIIILFLLAGLLLFLLGIVVGVLIGSQSITNTGIGGNMVASVDSAYYADGGIADGSYGGGISDDSGGRAVVNGVVLFKQGGSAPWASYSYGRGTTVASSGCGPTSIAMVLATYGINVTPDKIAQYSLDHGFRVYGAGTSWGIFKSVAQHYGLGLREVGGSVNAVKNQLAQGYPVIVSVKGPSKFTSGGHFLVVTGYENGKFLFNDPGGRNVKESTVSELSSALRNSWVFLRPGGG